MDTATFNALYARHYTMLGWWARYYGVPDYECDDVVQETYLRAWASGAEPQGTGAGWLWTIQRNMLIDRARWRRDPAAVVRGDIDVTLELQGHADVVDDRLEVDRLLSRLTPADRAIVEALMDGYNGVEIGAALGVSKVTVSRHFKVARAVMRGERYSVPYGGGGPDTAGHPMARL